MFSLTMERCFLIPSKLASLDLKSLTLSLEAMSESISLINLFSSDKLMDVVSCRFWSRLISASISSTELNRTEDFASFLSATSLSAAFLSSSSSARMARFSSMSLPFFCRNASMASFALPISVFLPEVMAASIFCWTLSLSFLSCSNEAFNSLSLDSWVARSGFSTRGIGLERSKSSSTGVSSSFFLRLSLFPLPSAFFSEEAAAVSSVTGAGAAAVVVVVVAASSAIVNLSREI
mmetsp:Transcript_3951/g.8502  ORF Transcript_3951/g.8502 Transcript_3951/m.8502 type:complete len:235 (+) Transcript_3951:1437-2141(+)